MFFKKKKKDVVNTEASILKREAKELINDHEKVKSDIQYLESQYEVFVLKSLIVEFPQYKEEIEKNTSEGQERTFWMIDRIRDGSFFLQKIPDLRNSYATKLSIDIDHNGKIDSEFELKSITIHSRSKSTKLSTSKFKDIVFKYIMGYTIAVSKKQLTLTKKSFEALSDLIGKDIHRDSKIDEILG